MPHGQGVLALMIIAGITGVHPPAIILMYYGHEIESGYSIRYIREQNRTCEWGVNDVST